MRNLILTLCLAATSYTVLANCPDTSVYDKAREVIADLGRIETPNGIQEAFSVKVNGTEQWVTVRGKDKANPIILFVHGGPATPITPQMWQFQRPLEDFFTVVNWDQRGAGKTYLLNEPSSLDREINVANYVKDTIELTQYILQRFDKRKVILMGHSWGTIVGMHAALKQPELYYAYVGIGQVINTRENERLSFDYAVAQSTVHQNDSALAELAEIAPYPGDEPLTRDRIVAARKWAQYYGGLTAYRSDSMYFFRAPLLSPDYRSEDVCALNQGSLFTLERLLEEFLAVDFFGVKQFPIPVVMFMGRHDYTTPSEPTYHWMSEVKAPQKHAIWFEHSSHMIPWEEPGRFLVELVNVVRPMAE